MNDLFGKLQKYSKFRVFNCCFEQPNSDNKITMQKISVISNSEDRVVDIEDKETADKEETQNSTSDFERLRTRRKSEICSYSN